MSTNTTLSADPGLSPVRTIAIAGGNRSVGQSCVAMNLARSLSNEGRKVLLFDADYSHSNLEDSFELDAKHDLSHVLNGEVSLTDAVVDAGEGLNVLFSGSGATNLAAMSQIEHVSVIRLFSELGVAADTVVIDLGSDLTAGALHYASAANEVMLVLCDEPTALQDAYSTIRAMRDTCQIQRFHILTNKIESSRHGLSLYSKLVRYIDRYMDDVLLDYCGSIPFESQLQEIKGEKRVGTDENLRSMSTEAFNKLAQRVDCWPRPTSARGHVEFFVERLIKAACMTG